LRVRVETGTPQGSALRVEMSVNSLRDDGAQQCSKRNEEATAHSDPGRRSGIRFPEAFQSTTEVGA